MKTKKAESIFTIVVSLIAVIAIFVVIIVGIRSKNAGNSNDSAEEVTKTETSEFTRVDIRLINSNIEILDSDDSSIKIVYFEQGNNTYTYSAKDGFIELTEKARPTFFSCSGWNLEPKTAKLYLPIGWVGILKVETVTGWLELNNRTGLKQLSMNTITGKIVLTNTNVDEYIDLEVITGSITISDVKANQYIKMETTTGAIKLTNIEALTGITAETTTGNITAVIKGVKEDFNIEMAALTGSVYLNGVKVSKEFTSYSGDKKISLETTTGSVKLDFAE